METRSPNEDERRKLRKIVKSNTRNDQYSIMVILVLLILITYKYNIALEKNILKSKLLNFRFSRNICPHSSTQSCKLIGLF
jgi:hypothetical protein